MELQEEFGLPPPHIKPNLANLKMSALRPMSNLESVQLIGESFL